MLGLTLNKLKVVSITNDGKFYAEIPFSKGLNVIRAENSSGKSTCINAIAYALGLNDILGPGKTKPFPRSMYQILETSKLDSTTHSVLGSYVELDISNRAGDRVTLIRDVAGYSDKVRVVGSDVNEEFFLGSAGEIGSAKSPKGFHFWLERFIGWSLPEVSKHDGRPAKLYFELIFPLFFIEQKRGWSEIQANTPTYYKVKDAKKSAIEYCLGVEDFSNRNNISVLKRRLENIENSWEEVKSSAISMAEFASMRVDFQSNIDSELFFPLVEYSLQNSDKPSSIQSVLKGLEANLENINSNIKTWPLYDQLAELLSKRRELMDKFSVINQREEALNASLDSNDSKAGRIRDELTRYRQLKRLSDVGAQLQLPVETKECPICGTDMLDTLSSKTDGVLSLEDNIKYLKNQLDFYLNIKNREEIELQGLASEKRIFDSQLTEITGKIESLRSDEEQFLSLYGDNMRERIELEKEINVYKKMAVQQDLLNDRARGLHDDWRECSEKLEHAKKSKSGLVSNATLQKLEDQLKENLIEFGYRSANIKYLQISPYTLRPELNGFDIVADSSASDYIRIIWSYTLALLQLASDEETAKHGGFVVFDEPRQHETDKESFKSLLKRATSIKDCGGQVIIATSISVSELDQYDLGNSANLTIFEDDEYILQKN